MKRGQFYLMAAIIIIVVIFSIYTARNYIQSGKEDTSVEEARYDLNYESARVVDWGIFNNEELDTKIEEWSYTYIRASEGKDIDSFVIAYGNSETLNFMTFEKDSVGEINIISGDSTIAGEMIEGRIIKKGTVQSEEDRVSIRIADGINYEIELESGQEFVFLIKKGGYVS